MFLFFIWLSSILGTVTALNESHLAQRIVITLIIIIFVTLHYTQKTHGKQSYTCLFLFFGLYLSTLFIYQARISNINSISSNTTQKKYNVQVIEKKYLKTDSRIQVKELDSGNIFLLIPPRHHDVKDLDYGGVYLVTALATFPDPPRNPGSFDYPTYMLRKGLSGTLKASSISLLETRIGNPFKRFAYFLKEKILDLHNSTLPYPYSHLFTGLIFGEDGTQLPEEMKARYKLTGLSHLLVVSGSQVSLLSGIVFQLLSALGLRRWKGFGLICVVNTVFYFVTGGGASIFRAILMNICMVYSKLFFYRTSTLTSISFSGLIMMFFNPFVIYDVGAQLSFLATCSLVYGVDYVEPLISKRLHNAFRSALAMSLAPFIFTTPLLWFQFHTISFVSILSNLLVVNMIELLVVIGFFSTLIGLVIYPLGYLLNQACLGVIWLLEWSTLLLAKLPFAEMVIPLHGGLLLLLYVYLVFFGYCIQEKKFLYLKYASTALGLILCFSFTFWRFQERPLTITFLDVGQGDCTVIQTPENHVIVIDTGGLKLNRQTRDIESYEATRSLLPFLTHIGVNSIDVLVTTHYDLDHIGGLIPLLKYKGAALYIDNGRSAKNLPIIPKLIRNKVDNAISITEPKTLSIGNDTSLTFLLPTQLRSFKSKNNSSIVVLLEHKGLKALFTGDLESEGEAHLSELYGYQLEADILKLGHHGSSTSSTLSLLEKVRPKVGIVSAGRFNRYGHPHPSVLVRFDSLGIPIYRTDKQGAIQISLVNGSLQITPFIPLQRQNV